MKKYYFVTYQEDNGRRVLVANTITTLHPIEMLNEMIEYVKKEHPPINYRYTILFWSEIPGYVAEKYAEVFE